MARISRSVGLYGAIIWLLGNCPSEEAGDGDGARRHPGAFYTKATGCSAMAHRHGRAEFYIAGVALILT